MENVLQIKTEATKKRNLKNISKEKDYFILVHLSKQIKLFQFVGFSVSFDISAIALITNKKRSIIFQINLNFESAEIRL